MSSFYFLEDRGRSFVELAEGNDWDKVICSVNPDHQRAGRRNTPLHISLTGSKPVDVSWTILSDMVVTERTVELLQQANIRGFELRPAVLVPPSLDLRLTELVPTERVRLRQDSVVLKESCDVCSLARYVPTRQGIHIDSDSWRGADIFSLSEFPRYICVSSRLRDLLTTAAITNIRLTEAEKVHWPALFAIA